MGVIITLPGPGLEPLRQGDLDGLCGLYAAINGIQLALSRSASQSMSRRELRRLFGRGVAFLTARHQLTSATQVGIEERFWRELVDALARAAGRITGAPVRCSRPLDLIKDPTADNLFWLVEEAVRQRQPVLIGLGGRHDHYTVVESCTPDHLLLFDSGNLHRLARTACSVGDQPLRRHVIRPDSIAIVEVG